MGEKIAEVPVSYTPRSAGEGKKIRHADGWLAIWTLVRYRFGHQSGWETRPSATTDRRAPFAVSLSRLPTD
jgi:hypothetical protein